MHRPNQPLDSPLRSWSGSDYRNSLLIAWHYSPNEDSLLAGQRKEPLQVSPVGPTVPNEPVIGAGLQSDKLGDEPFNVDAAVFATGFAVVGL